MIENELIENWFILKSWNKLIFFGITLKIGVGIDCDLYVPSSLLLDQLEIVTVFCYARQ